MKFKNEATSLNVCNYILSIAVSVMIILVLLPDKAIGHSGGLNSQGCHAGSKPYHCHRSSSEMVGNRLRCDLGSESAECQSGNRSNSNATSNQSINSTTETTPRNIDFSADALTIFGVGFDLDIGDAKGILTNRFSCFDWRKSNITGSGYEYDCRVKDGGTPVNIKTDTLGRIDSFLFACETFGGCAYTPKQIYSFFKSQNPLVGRPETTEDTICDEGKLGERICFWDYKRYIYFSRNRFKQDSLKFD